MACFDEKMKEIGTYIDSNSTLIIPEGVDFIENGTFKNNGEFKRVKLPSTLTYIADAAFKSCVNLREVEIPDSVDAFGKKVFADCYALTSVKLPSSMTITSPDLFSSCINLTDVYGVENLREIAKRTFYDCRNLKSVCLTGAVNIRMSAFAHCKELKNVTFSDKLAFIDYDAFNDTSIVTVGIPAKAVIRNYAFPDNGIHY